MSKKVLGLDLGTTSIGWAFVCESPEADDSSIIRLGVRVNPLTTDEQKKFEEGKPATVNADRTLKRSMRRNLQRYKLRRDNLIQILKESGLIREETGLAEDGKHTTHATHAIRAKAACEAIALEDLARVLLMINKKRGYKSSRKIKSSDEGSLIDGMSVAKRLYEEDLTPGQLCFQLLKEGKRQLPDFYRSDLEIEMEKIWSFQKQFHPEILTDAFRKSLEGKGQRATSAAFWGTYKFNTAENKGTREEKKLKAYEWRSKAINTQLSKEEAAFVITEINSNINNASGYLGAISDRSKELYFSQQTVGQYLYKQVQANPHARLKNQVFYRQDYLDEFERIWETQAQFHKELTPALKETIRDVIIFYQRKLKSQKGLISFCEFESRKIEVEIDGKKKTKTTGYRVSPKSSPLFQEFKIWQNLGNLERRNKKTKEVSLFDETDKQLLFEELNIKGNIPGKEALRLLGAIPDEWDLNFATLEGNRTHSALYQAYLEMMEQAGYDCKELLNLDKSLDSIKLQDARKPAHFIKKMISDFFESYGIDKSILEFNAELDGKAFEKQSSFQLWHLLYAYQEDDSTSGNEHLYQLLQKKFGFTLEQAKILGTITFQDDYGSLSAKAMRRIIPFLKELKYAAACAEAGYNHSSFLTKEENEQRPLKEKLALLPKNSLRNPVVEKILNQMVNVVNAIIADPDLGKPDEIRIELARELKKNAKERATMTEAISKANARHEKIKGILKNDFGISNPTKNDITRYKLYEELKHNGYKTLYSNTYIPKEKLFSKEFDIEHIVPKALLFDDSFSNKTLCVRQENLDKGSRCAAEFIGPYFGEESVQEYVDRVERLYQVGIKNSEEGISKAKYKKLLMKTADIGRGFIERDLRETQYIVKKAKQMLQEVCKDVMSTSGQVTDRLREDWGLVNIMQELSIAKYRALGMTEMVERKDGQFKEKIKDWSKRNDHRHHAMDALTVAFTKRNHIQYLNNLNARKQEDEKGREIQGIERKETVLVIENDGSRKRRFKPPMTNFRAEAKRHLEEILVSHKAKNKVTTRNKNKFKTGNGENSKVELTPRGQLHNQTVYGKIARYVTKEEKIGVKTDEAFINRVASEKFKHALLHRLQEFGNDPKKAFTGKNSLEKNPLFTYGSHPQRIPEKVKTVWQEYDYTTRKDITPENFKEPKNIEKIIDAGIRTIMSERLRAFNNNAKEAFSNLDKNPIWLNQEKGIAIKRVTISGIKNAEALHTKKDHFGKDILDQNGYPIPVDFVSTSGNHHVAIYKDAEGKLQENVVSFFEAVVRAKQGLPIIDKFFNKEYDWEFLFTMKQNEYFVFPAEGFDPDNFDLMDPANRKLISPNLFRVQKIASKNYFFRHHLETNVEEQKELKGITYKPQLGLKGIEGIIKVRINHLGQICHVGDY